MSDLLNKQKAIKEEISNASYKESTFSQKSKEAYRTTHDSTVYKPLIDSETYYYMRGIHLKETEKQIEYSIDSLSEMN
jgi:hypothetical protein